MAEREFVFVPTFPTGPGKPGHVHSYREADAVELGTVEGISSDASVADRVASLGPEELLAVRVPHLADHQMALVHDYAVKLGRIIVVRVPEQ